MQPMQLKNVAPIYLISSLFSSLKILDSNSASGCICSMPITKNISKS